jgi:hypothetical protein
LAKANHLLDKDHVLVFKLVNQPGILGKVAKRLGEANVNIDYIYGSAMEDAKESIFVVHIAESEFHKVKDTLKGL